MYRLLLVTLNSDEVLTGILSTEAFESPIMAMNGVYYYNEQGHNFERVEGAETEKLQIECRSQKKISYKEVFRQKDTYLFIIEESAEIPLSIFFIYDGIFKQIDKQIKVRVENFNVQIE